MSDAWKDLERRIADKLGGYRRIARGQNYRISDFDVEVTDFPHWRIDAKYRRQKFKHHAMLRDIREKYCEKGDVPILVTKNAAEHGEVVSMLLDDFAGMVNALRAVRGGANGV